MPGPARKRPTPGNETTSGRIARARKQEKGSAKKESPRPSSREEDLSRLRSLSGQERTDVVLELQRRYGNRRVGQMLDHLSRPDIPATVQSTPAASVAAAGRDVEQDEPDVVTPELASRIEQERGGGKPMDSETRADMESSFGQDFGDVRVHTGSQADQLNREVQARAFTTGSDVFFREGTYAPDSSAGKELLAHELTHVVQQSDVSATGPSRITSPDDAVEKEADSVAEAMVARQAEEEEELPLARQMEEEEELPLPEPMEEEAPAANPVILALWDSNVITPLSDAAAALETPTDDNQDFALDKLQDVKNFIEDLASGYDSAGNQVLAEKLRTEAAHVSVHVNDIFTHMNGPISFFNIQRLIGWEFLRLDETRQALNSSADAVEQEAASIAQKPIARKAEEKELPLARQMEEEEELPLARQMEEEEELPLARQMAEEEELPLARQMEEEQSLAAYVLLALWESNAVTPLAQAQAALDTPTDDNLHYAAERVHSAVMFIGDLARVYDGTGNQLLAEQLRTNLVEVSMRGNDIRAHINGAVPFGSIQQMIGLQIDVMKGTGQLLT